MSSIDVEINETNEEYISYENDQELKIEQLSDIEEDYDQKPIKTEVTGITKYGDYTAKCGEIFISNTGKMFYACVFCDMNFKTAESFKNHVFKQHLNLPEEDYGDPEDPTTLKPFEGEHDQECSIASEGEEGSYQIIDVEYEKVSVLDEDPIKIDFLADILYESDTTENKNHNNSLGEPFLTKSTNAADDTSETEGITDSYFYCEVCRKKFKTKRGLAKHKVRHEFNASLSDIMVAEYYNSEDDESKKPNPVETMENSLKCPYCGKQFRNKAERVCHERTHTGEKPFKCDICGNTFRLSRQLEGHMRTHTGERPFSCPQCPAKFANRTNMTVHVRTHLGIKRFSCDVCDKRFVRNVEKRIHMRSHTGEKPYQCETCGASYSASCKLTEHMKRHTNTKPHQCEICFKYFYSRDLLKNHQTMHSDERPFECSMCDSKFPRKRALQCHMKIHSDVKEYVCKICGKAFAQNAGLYGHMKTHGHKLGAKTKELESISSGAEII